MKHLNKYLIILGLALIYYGCDTADASYKAKYESQVLLTNSLVLLTDSLQVKNTQINVSLDNLKTTAFHIIDSLKAKIVSMPDSTYWVNLYYEARTKPVLNSLNERIIAITDSLKKK